MKITKEAIEAGVAAFESAFNGSPNSTEMVTTILTAAFAAMPGPAVQLKPLEWSDPCEPNEDCRYNHVTAKAAWTYQIQWKAWKEHDAFVVYRDGDYIDCKYSLDEAKAFASADRDARILSALTPATDLASENERLRAALKGIRETIFELKFALFSTDMTIKDRADQSARLTLAALERT